MTRFALVCGINAPASMDVLPALTWRSADDNASFTSERDARRG